MLAPLLPPIDAAAIQTALASAVTSDPPRVRDILAEARDLGGLRPDQAACLLTGGDPDLDQEIFAAARAVKASIYGNRLVLFAPLYITNRCQNDCLYCAFRASNRDLVRRDLTPDEIASETRVLLRQGHKRVLLVAGEHHAGGADVGDVVRAIETIYGVNEGGARVRRINVNVAALDVAQYRELKRARIGTYQLFQETYHRPTYATMHPAGPKADYDWHLGAIDRAMSAGIDDCGIGALLGLYDHRHEVLAMLEHARHLEQTFGAGPHTISVPRLEPAAGSDVAARPPHAVGDREFLRLVAVLRLAVPYTGIILSTRESAAIRSRCFDLGVSQISASSRTNPGGYGEAAAGAAAGEQFSLGDHRTLDDVVADVLGHGYLPSFCTACYRRGRTGRDFMDLARPGLIRDYCQPNALLTLKEYLEDHAGEATRALGARVIERSLREVDHEGLRELTTTMLARIERGERDLSL